MQALWIKIAISMAIVAGLSLLQAAFHTKRVNRYRQAIFPFLALIYGIVSMAVTFLFFDMRSPAVDLVVELLNTLAGNEGFSAEIPAVNISVGGIYVAVKLLFLLIFCILLKKYLPLRNVVDIFYQYDEKWGEWLLISRWMSVRKIFQGFVFAGTVLSGILLGITWEAPAGSFWHVMVFPIVLQIVLVEISSFLGGFTDVEYERMVGGDDSHSQKINNFYKIREIYEKTFRHELLASYTGCDYSSAQAVLDLLHELGESDDELERKVAQFFLINGKDEIYDTDCIQATLKMLKGENVIFFNPFYRDLGKYLILPFIETLLSDRKGLIVVGRNSAKKDIMEWTAEILDEYTKIEALWRVKELDFKEPDCEIGILGFSQLYDQRLLDVNRDFLSDVGFVFLLEASRIINTGQVGLSILAQQMTGMGEGPVYCIADRLVDGLVDTMSHLLQTEITEVVAAPVARNVHTAMGWNADGDYLRERLFDKQTRYLGNGIELAALAIKNQIPRVAWFGESKAPVRDMKWVAGQYYPALCRYMNLPVQQQSIYDKIKFVANIWSVPEEKEQFVIAEDEFCNLFGAVRTFISRGKFQTFVNVLSENYLLRDYMRCNTQMFLSNPNLIPSIVPDYAKTERNVLLKLLLLMSYREVYESEILREFAIVGLESEDALHIMSCLLRKYTCADTAVFNVRIERTDTEDRERDEENVYSILPEVFEEKFGKSLKNAYYLCEEEERQSEYIDAKLFGHVTQTILQGQYVTYNGKYYVVKQISPNIGVILRRASNLYDGRKYYRQIRRYSLGNLSEDGVLTVRTIMDIELAKLNLDFKVTTSGYLEMNSNHDLRSARVVDISGDPHTEDYIREYHNKAVMRVKLPDTDDRIRFSVCMLLTELFRSIFPDAWHYLAVVTVMPDDVDGMLNYLIYDVDGCVEEEYIYILEDSELDLGLLEAVEKNLMKFLEIITDFLNWHFEKMREPAMKDPEIITPEFPAMDVRRRRKLNEMFTRIGKLFGGKREEDVRIGSAEEAERKPVKAEEDADKTEKSGNAEQEELFTSSGTVNMTAGQFEPEKKETPDLVAIDGTDIFDNEGMGEDNDFFENCFAEMGITPLTKTRYQKECFLKFGFEEIDSRIQLEEVRKYLTVRGFSKNALVKARKREKFDNSIIDVDAVNHCDFCGMPLSGVSFEKLSDGRIRCNDCSASAINSAEEFRKLFAQCENMMESFFSIDFKVSVTVKTADAEKIAKGYGSVFTPSAGVASRVLGFAQRKNGKFSLYVENGSPRLATIETMSHELTHIWQYINWKDEEIKRLYPEDYKRDIVYEGMAEWVSVQYMYLIGEYSYARKMEILLNNRNDIYGVGFKMFSEKYPIIRDSSLVTFTPFTQFPPM